MQAFRNAAKPLMVVVALTFFAWLVVDLSGITGNTGLLTKTSVGKVNGRSIDARTYQTVVQQSIDARQREAPGALGLEDYQQIRDEVWEQFVQNSVLDAEYQRRGITVSEDEIVEAIRTSPPPEFQKIPEFQTDSQFDLGKYQRWLTSSVAPAVPARRSRPSTASSSSAPSSSGSSPPTSTSPTPRSGSSTATSTRRSRSASPPSSPATSCPTPPSS